MGVDPKEWPFAKAGTGSMLQKATAVCIIIVSLMVGHDKRWRHEYVRANALVNNILFCPRLSMFGVEALGYPGKCKA